MSDQQVPFTYALLESRLQKRTTDALRTISILSAEDVLTCDNACLTEIVRQFVIVPPVLQRHRIEADEKILESEDLVSLQKTGDTMYSFFLPIGGESQWLEEVDSQRPNDGKPLAFLDERRARIAIRLVLGAEDEEGTLQHKLDYRVSLLERYAHSVAAKIVKFNENLAGQMTTALNARKSTVSRGERELEKLGLPRVHNPEHAERSVQIERIYQSLGAYVTDTPSRFEASDKLDVRPFIVHGHDHGTLYELKNYLQNTLKLGEPVILHETPNVGKMLMERFEREAGAVELVFVLLTPDDKVADLADANDEKRRARQNVIFELGFFLGKLGRENGRVLLLHKGPLELPSDILGITYIDVANGIQSAGEDIRRELKALEIMA